MSNPNLYNFQSCCRLCLTVKIENSKSIFDGSVEDCALQQKIFQYLGIEIIEEDIFSTVVCSQCIIKLIGFHSYKERCERNQSELQKWLMNSYQTFTLNEFADASLQIKEEPMGDTDITDSYEALENYIETTYEPMDHVDGPMTKEYNELPSASPSRSLDLEQSQNDVTDLSKSQLLWEPQTDEDSDQQKIKSTSGIKLMTNNSTPISCEVSSKIDFSYIDKCKDMVTMHETLSASNVHDDSKGVIRSLDDNYKIKKLLKDVAAEEEEESEVILTDKRKREASITESDENRVKVINPFRKCPKSNETKCPIFLKGYSSYHNMRRHYRLHASKKLNMVKDKPEEEFYSCPDCGGLYGSVAWKNHLVEKHELDSCRECGKSFQFQTELEQHRNVHLDLNVHTISEILSNKSIVNINSGFDEKPRMFCAICDVVVANKKELNDHRLSHEKALSEASAEYTSTELETRKCEYCNEKFATNTDLWRHITRFHPERNNPSPSDHEIPIMTKEVMVTDLSGLSCDVCVKTFKSKSALKEHMKKHIGKVELTKQKSEDVFCQYCEMSFNSADSLMKHKLKEHKGCKTEISKTTAETDEFACSICAKSFPLAKALSCHMGWHSRQNGMNSLGKNTVIVKLNRSEELAQESIDEPNFECATCSAVLPNDTALQVHILEEHESISAIKMFSSCKVCNTYFSTQDEHETHKRLHEYIGRKKQQREQDMLLPKQEQSQLVSREMAERNEVASQSNPDISKDPPGKCFPCTYCGNSFTRLCNLWKHIRKYHKENVQRELECSHCDKTFNKRSLLTLHLKSHKSHTEQRIRIDLPNKTHTPAVPNHSD